MLVKPFDYFFDLCPEVLPKNILKKYLMKLLEDYLMNYSRRKLKEEPLKKSQNNMLPDCHEKIVCSRKPTEILKK